jgi:hypothetical protein
MGRKTIKYSWLLIIGSLLFPQSMINRLKVPVIIKGTMGFGYDNNFLRFSEKEIREDDVTEYGISSTLDSPILKPTIKFIYSPAIIYGKTTNIITSVSYSHFTQADQKSYLISSVSMEMKLRSYSWIKVGIRDIPNYYLRKYYDRDLSNVDYYNCTFSSQGYFASYSLPIKRLHRTWMKVYVDYTKEYYNSHFTEFDLHKTMVQLDLNRKYKKKYQMKISISHGNAENISYDSNLPSTGFDRSYVFDKVRGEFVYKSRRIDTIEDIGISVQLEQRYYNLLSEEYSFDNWKYYLDGRAKVWVDWDIIDDIGFKTYYQFRWRDASTQLYGNFDWVEDIKSYSKHEIWLEFSFKFITNILY